MKNSDLKEISKEILNARCLENNKSIKYVSIELQSANNNLNNIQKRKFVRTAKHINAINDVKFKTTILNTLELYDAVLLDEINNRINLKLKTSIESKITPK